MWPVSVDKGYDGAAESTRAVNTTQKPTYGQIKLEPARSKRRVASDSTYCSTKENNQRDYPQWYHCVESLSLFSLL